MAAKAARAWPVWAPRRQGRNGFPPALLLKGATAAKEYPMLWRASDVHGTAIEATDGSIGSVDDFLFSDDRWTVRWAVIDTGNWLPGRRVLLPPDRLIHA